MATNYTEHYGLSLWEANDKFYHQEFNENHRKLDTALHSHAAALETKANAAQTAASIQSLEERKASVVTGSYIGNGLYGADYPNSLDFAGSLGHAPKLLIVRPKPGQGIALILVRGMTGSYYTPGGTNDSSTNIAVTWTETGLSWSSRGSYYQYNYENEIYVYFAIG